MSLRRTAAILLGLALTATIAVGLTQLPSGSTTSSAREAPLSAARQQALLEGSPAPLAALHRQAGLLLGGGASALKARMAALHGYPAVVNKWASWCVPCRAELGSFQRVAARLGRRVAFMGLDSGDSSRADALAFMRAHSVSYPSWYDPTGAGGAQITDSSFTPVTVFVPARGTRFVYQGQFPSAKKLEEDVIRYALHG